MIYIILTISIVVIASIYVLNISSNFPCSIEIAVDSIATVALGISLAFGISGVFLMFDWEASAAKANLINSEYGTKYTQSDIFWASDVIDTIQQIKRKRIEINGGLLKGEK